MSTTHTITLLERHHELGTTTHVYVDGTPKRGWPGHIGITLPTVIAWLTANYRTLNHEPEYDTLGEALAAHRPVLGVVKADEPIPSRQQIHELRAEMSRLGNSTMVVVCERALQGHEPSIVMCAAAIAEAQGMEEE